MSMPTTNAPRHARPNAVRRTTRIARPARPRSGTTSVARASAVVQSSGSASSRTPRFDAVKRPSYWPRNCSPVTRNQKASKVVGWL
jgi:hypothetical protein